MLEEIANFKNRLFAMIWRYQFIGLLRLSFDYVLTKIFYRNARLVRFPIYIRGKKLIKFGNGLTTGVNVRLDAFQSGGIAPILHIGCNVQINDSVHIGAIERVVIGDDVLIASRVFISDHNHGDYHATDLLSAPEISPIKRPLSSRPVYIGNNVWIGEQVCILPGVSIGDGSIIGANAVVTRDVPPNSIAVGNPARVIRIYDQLEKKWRRI
jgi:lipopolysaccharide O-acetyltransferase